MISLLLALAVQEDCYYPLQTGSTWTFKGRIGTTLIEITNKITGKEKVGDVECAVLESTRKGQDPKRECLARTKEGIAQLKYGGELVDPPLLVLQLPLKVGATWSVTRKVSNVDLKITSTIEAEEETAVPAGIYQAFRVVTTYETATGKEVIIVWYAKDVGPILIQVGDVILSLQSFTPGKD